MLFSIDVPSTAACSATDLHGRGQAMTVDRKALHAYVSDNAHEHWHCAAATWGVSVSALLEALAPVLYESVGEGEAALHEVVGSARMIDSRRRRGLTDSN